MNGEFAEFNRTPWLGSEEDLIGGYTHVGGNALEVLRVDDVAGHHFGEDDSEREDVDTAVKILAQQDLWCLFVILWSSGF